jgi:predicted MPP superfamily phosphohydrolase
MAPLIERKAPIPHGPFSGRRSRWRRLMSRVTGIIDRVVDQLPVVGPLLHRRLHRRLAFTQHDVPLRRGGSGLAGLRIAFLSDLHAGCCMGEADLCRIFARVAEAAPDLVCLGGDLINTRDREILAYRKPLGLLRPPLGVFAVPGNHDHFHGRDIGLWTAFLHEQGVRVLINRGERLARDGSSLWLAGVDDLTEATPDLRAALEGSRPDEPVVLLSHHPDFFFEAAAVDVDLTLSGHTHGGQVAGLGRLLKHTQLGYWHGMFEEGTSRLFVSRGVGVTFLPVRIGVEAEVAFLRLVPGSYQIPPGPARPDKYMHSV